jgi:NAD(P)-dependent dehydrogenase (short-subunit alcohol dehydrogenase family)
MPRPIRLFRRDALRAQPRQGQVSLVTGGASGIGAALCSQLAAEGSLVVVADRDAAGAARLADAIGGEALALDVTDGPGFTAAADQLVARHGRLDHLFNNAGVGLAGEVRDLSEADWRRIIDVDIWGVVNGIRAVYPHLIAQGFGHIVNTASGAGLSPRPGMTPYAMAKHAVVGLTTSLRPEAARHGVRVSAVCPGFIATDIMNSTPYVGLDAKRLQEKIPFKPITAKACAARTLSGMDRNEVLIPVGANVWFDWMLGRVSTRLADRVAGLRAKAFADARR